MQVISKHNLSTMHGRFVIFLIVAFEHLKLQQYITVKVCIF
jgi:hypothetical protein